jgi:hypothetical protein
MRLVPLGGCRPDDAEHQVGLGTQRGHVFRIQGRRPDILVARIGHALFVVTTENLQRAGEFRQTRWRKKATVLENGPDKGGLERSETGSEIFVKGGGLGGHVELLTGGRRDTVYPYSFMSTPFRKGLFIQAPFIGCGILFSVLRAGRPQEDQEQSMIRKTGLPLVLSLALAGISMAADAPPDNASTPASTPAGSQPEQNAQELEEVWVQGKRLAHRIEDAEDEFFPLYNKANKNNDFDIRCGYAYLSVDTMIMGRTCIADFLGRSYGPPVYWSSCYGYGGFYGSSPRFFGYRGPYVSYGACVDAYGYEPPSAELILMARKDDLRRNMLKVINNDPELLKKAAHLGDLYRELEAVQKRYRTAKGIKVKGSADAKPKPVRVNTGPRTF